MVAPANMATKMVTGMIMGAAAGRAKDLSERSQMLSWKLMP